MELSPSSGLICCAGDSTTGSSVGEETGVTGVTGSSASGVAGVTLSAIC